MRISDWSSDVCSSDLRPAKRRSMSWPGEVTANEGLRWSSSRRTSTDTLSDSARMSSSSASSSRDLSPSSTEATSTIGRTRRSEEHTSELQSLMRISYAVFCLKKHTSKNIHTTYISTHAK